MTTTLIVGCGDVGSRLAQCLLAEGHEVHGVRRSTQAIPGVVLHSADVRQPLSIALPAAEYLCILLSPDASTPEEYQRTYVDSLRHVRAAMPAQHLRRVLFVSSTSVYGEEGGGWVDEQTPALPATFNGQVLLRAEAEAAACWPGLTTVVRMAGIYGEGRTWLLRWAASGKPVAAGQWSNRIHAADAAALLALLLRREAAGLSVPELCLGVDNQPVLLAEVLDGLAAAQGLPALPRLPGSDVASGRRIRNARARALGFVPQYPDWRAGYAALLPAP